MGRRRSGAIDGLATHRTRVSYLFDRRRDSLQLVILWAKAFATSPRKAERVRCRIVPVAGSDPHGEREENQALPSFLPFRTLCGVLAVVHYCLQGCHLAKHFRSKDIYRK